LKKPGDLAGLLTNLEEAMCCSLTKFIAAKNHRGYLYPAMEDFKLDIIIDQARTPAASA